MEQKLHTVCICGAGTMGSGIAQVTAMHGLYTTLYDVSQQIITAAEKSIDQALTSLIQKNRITNEAKKEALEHLRYTGNIQDCISEIIIEAVVEKPEVKVALFKQLAEINTSETIFATNTSSLSITEIAAKITHPERVIGMHFFNPPFVMKLVEVVSTSYTNDNTTRRVIELAKQLNKVPVLCTDTPGFIVNRIARPYYIESLRLVEAGFADFALVDRLLEASGFRMGPFKLMDLIGNDVNYLVSSSVYEQLGRPQRLKPSYIQEEKVKNNELGRKTGKGYYQY